MNYERLNDLRLLGLTIAYYRRAKGMTQAELAEADDPDLQFFFRHAVSLTILAGTRALFFSEPGN